MPPQRRKGLGGNTASNDTPKTLQATTPPVSPYRDAQWPASGNLAVVPTPEAPSTAVPAEGQVVKLPVGEVARNPRNPRRPHPDVTDLESIREKQLQAGRGVTRAAYLRLYPEDEAKIGDAEHVAVLGCRRHLACEKYDVPTYEMVIDDSMAESRATLRAWALRENIDRKSLDVVEEAEALKQQVAELGSQAEAARSIGRTEAFVSQRLRLLKLVPEMLEKLRAGEIAIEEARNLALVPAPEQVARWMTAQLAKLDADPDADAEPQPKPSKPRAGVVQIAKALKRWNAEPDVLAVAIGSELEPAQIRVVVDKLTEQLQPADETP
ncbi:MULTISPECIES: peptide transporter [unclassified Nocardia]|uniref:ParB/RepB/Spo0J family partition protein n=1 Tax=unclassified Nocardia TaxID=2637762 RepID=UPI00278C2525|nr:MULTISPECIES: peptide transporter [unclassified Nocardia]